MNIFLKYLLANLIVLFSGVNIFAQQPILKSDYPAVTALKTVGEGGSLDQEVIPELTDTIYISSIVELATIAKSSGRNVVMQPGVYQMKDYLTPTVIGNTVPDVINRYAMLEISGSNNYFDFTGVTIEVATELLNDFGKYVIEFYVTGDNNVIKGLTLTDIGNEPTASGGNSFTVEGYNNRIENVTLNVNGSYPYGYGDLLGKGSDNLVGLKKHSGMLVSGTADTIVGCTIISKAFGHCFFVQGGSDILFQDCYAEGKIRATNDMLAETSGPAYDLDFACVYKNQDGEKVIPPGYTKSLSECGFRTYGTGGINGSKTGAVAAIGCSTRNTRIGFAFTRVADPMSIENCEAYSCEAGYNITGVKIINSKGDVAIGPLLYINNGDPCTVGLTLINDTTSTIIHAIACIAGSGHWISLKRDGDQIRPQTHSILLGSSRPAGSNPFSPFGSVAATHVTLNNTTGMPIKLASNTNNCKISSNATVTDLGFNNQITNIDE